MKFSEVIFIENFIVVFWRWYFIDTRHENVGEFIFLDGEFRKSSVISEFGSLSMNFLDMLVGKCIKYAHFGIEECQFFRRTHSDDLKIVIFVDHKDSVIFLEIKVNET